MKTGFASLGDDPIPFLTHFRSAILPLPHLAEKSAGLGGINWIPDRDLIVRKAPLLFSLGGAAEPAIMLPSLDAEALRVAQGVSTIVVKSSNASGAPAFGASTGIVSVKIGEAEIDTESDGMVRVRFAGTQAGRHISAWRVLDGQVTPGRGRRQDRAHRIERRRAFRSAFDAPGSGGPGHRHPCRIDRAYRKRSASRTARLRTRPRSFAPRPWRIGGLLVGALRQSDRGGGFYSLRDRRFRGGKLLCIPARRPSVRSAPAGGDPRLPPIRP